MSTSKFFKLLEPLFLKKPLDCGFCEVYPISKCSYNILFKCIIFLKIFNVLKTCQIVILTLFQTKTLRSSISCLVFHQHSEKMIMKAPLSHSRCYMQKQLSLIPTRTVSMAAYRSLRCLYFERL